MTNANRFYTIIPVDAEMMAACTKNGVDFFARKREDGKVDLFSWLNVSKTVDEVSVAIADPTWMKEQFRIAGPVSSKTQAEIEPLFNSRVKKGLVLSVV